MRTKIEVTLLAMLVVGGGYCSTSWWMGLAVQQRLQQTEQQLLDDTGYLTLVARNYQRGIFSSTEDVTYGIGGSMSQLLRASAAGRALGSVRLTVHNTIYHGPLPRLRTLAYATVDSELQLPPEVRQRVNAVLGGKPIVQVRTTMRFLGASEAVVLSPAFHTVMPDGTTLLWHGVTGTVRATPGMERWSGTLAAPGLTIQGPAGGIELTDLNFSASMQRALDTFYTGQSALRVGSIAFRPVTGKTISLRGISLNGDSGLHSGYFDEHATVSADRLDSADLSMTRVAYEQRLSHLDAASLAALIDAARKANRTLLPAGAARIDATRAKLDVFRRYALELALRAPVLEIERLGFLTPEGELRLSAKVAIPGLTREELQGPTVAAAIMLHLDARADLRIDAALLDKLLEASRMRAQASAQLEQLERLGYLRRDGNALATELAYHAGSLTINGQPYRPIVGTVAP